MKLYEMTGAFNEIFAMMEDGEELNYSTLEDTLQALEGAIEEKVGNIAKMIKSLEVQAEGFDKEAKRLTDKKRTIENKIKWLKEYLLQAMEATAKDKILTDIGTVRRQKSPAGVSVTDPDEIPQNYWFTPEPELDKKLILADLKSGVNIPGVQLRQGYHIRIQ
ncbi:siphovirus Gp157 family protein [Desulforamulus hydrothermalis]|uniref:Siphovirus Gp157 family protein n=1 Tax=Desulforamulus hydrothermalis Lam5 = DSM 18033 TaxID=1121428 RepID=K8DZ20_9FIRM|nr:siphovirus Gp157 family protein [Desulforamulus hydrothermalis]CCO08247.1 conserved hypothetical protein [Desulforamulus hydrothermalis Lam5 = DSM 18033]SHH43663.1 virus Gp157 [Desulforamulus hydrothermalis Lam5 = DSM 18033]